MRIQIISEKFIHYTIKDKALEAQTHLTVVYAHNSHGQRAVLWQELMTLGASILTDWVLARDFNSVLTSIDRLGSLLLPSRFSIVCGWDTSYTYFQ